MNRVPEILRAFGDLLNYPTERMAVVTEWLYILIKDELPHAGRRIADFGTWSERATLGEWEEAYTRTFDNNPQCALEIGWHLFGEEYARGMFLVRMREELRRFGFAESSELPDHIVHVLQIVSAMPAEESAKFVAACVLPGVRKLRDGIGGQSTPYADVIGALAEVLERAWSVNQDASEGATRSPRAHRDPLHAFPVADVIPGCGGCMEEQRLVPLMREYSATSSDESQAWEMEDQP